MKAGFMKPLSTAGTHRKLSKTVVLTAVEVRGSAPGRIRMEAVDDLSADTLCGFVQDNVLEGSTVRTDACQGFKRLGRLGYDHQPVWIF